MQSTNHIGKNAYAFMRTFRKENGEMKRVILEIDDDYAGVLSVTAIGGTACGMKVSTYAVALEDCDRMIIDSVGKCTPIRKAEKDD